MKALQIDRHGPPADLRVRDVPDPPLRPGELRVQIEAAAVNPSDVASAEGKFPDSPLPRVLGRDFAGRVVEGPAEWRDSDVWGSGGDLGITRDGTHAEQVVLPIDGVARRPRNLSVEAAAAAGVPFVTAWAALVDAGALATDDWVIVSGAAGAVGGAAIEIAAARGARIIALVKDESEVGRVRGAQVAAVARSDLADLVDVVREATGGKGATLALNGVGATIFQSTIDALAEGGRMVVYSAAGGREARLDLFVLYRRRLSITGVNTGALSASDGARILSTLAPLFERGEIGIRQPVEREALSAAPRAYARVAEGAPNKVVLVPDTRLSD